MTVPVPAADADEEFERILEWLEEKPTLSRYVGAARRLDEFAQHHRGRFSEHRIAVVRNVTIEPVEALLKVAAYRSGIRARMGYSGYDPADVGAIDELLDDDYDAVMLVLWLEDLAPALGAEFVDTAPEDVPEIAAAVVRQVVELAERSHQRTRAPVLVHNFVCPQSPSSGLADHQNPDGQVNVVRWMNRALAQELQRRQGLYVVDLDHALAGIGLRNAYDDRGQRTAGAPLSLEGLRALAEADVRSLVALRGPAVKCIVVDCDNTLWGGVVGEDGPAGLALDDTGPGRRHRRLQQSLRHLRSRGIVLAVCSKNEADDVLEVLRSHPDCLLREDDFAALRINWEDKAENIASIAKELNLGLEHLAFVDDNPFECELIRTRLPTVRVIWWPEDLNGGALEDFGLFASLSVTHEDRMRTAMYQAEGKRRLALDEAPSVEDYLGSLSMVATIGAAESVHLARIAQLTQRTNQFNLTTRRYDASALSAAMEDPTAIILWLDLRDRFGPHGVVGCGIARLAGPSALVDTLLLSCRVLGRGAEAVVVHHLARWARDLGAQELVGEYLPSPRNAQVADLYGRLGFRGPDPVGSGTRWRWSLADGLPSHPQWFDVVVTEAAL